MVYYIFFVFNFYADLLSRYVPLTRINQGPENYLIYSGSELKIFLAQTDELAAKKSEGFGKP